MANGELDIHVAGIPLGVLTGAGWGDLDYSTLANGGCGDASWSMSLPDTYSNPSLVIGKIVEIKAGPQNLYKGILNEPTNADDGSGWQFAATGLYTRGSGRLAFDSDGNITGVANTALDQAIATGIGWQRPHSISSSAVVVPADSSQPMFIADLLDMVATNGSQRWGVDADGNVYLRTDSTTPDWIMAAGSGRFGLADDEYATHIFLRYQKSDGSFGTATAEDTIAAAQFGRVDYPVDGTTFGALTDTVADNLAAGLLAKGLPRLGWTNPVTPSAWQITSPGGVPAAPWMVRGGDLVRLHGVLNEQGQPLPYVDFVIGQAELTPADGTLTLTPVDLAPRDLSTVLTLAAS